MNKVFFANYNCNACLASSLPPGYVAPANYPLIPSYMDNFTIKNNLIFQYLASGITLTNLANSTVISNTVIRQTPQSAPDQSSIYYVNIALGGDRVVPTQPTTNNVTFTQNVSDNLYYEGNFANASNLKPAGKNVTDHYPPNQPTLPSLFNDYLSSTITQATTVKNVVDSLTANRTGQLVIPLPIAGFIANVITSKWNNYKISTP